MNEMERAIFSMQMFKLQRILNNYLPDFQKAKPLQRKYFIPCSMLLVSNLIWATTFLESSLAVLLKAQSEKGLQLVKKLVCLGEVLASEMLLLKAPVGLKRGKLSLLHKTVRFHQVQTEMHLGKTCTGMFSKQIFQRCERSGLPFTHRVPNP